VSTEEGIMPMTPEGLWSGVEADHLPVPSRNILADDVHGILRDSLLAGRIAPGSRLNLDHLARELHVSNTPVRQALARLEAEGLVTKEPYRGFAASRLLDSRTISELYEYRLILEPAIAARAAGNAPVAREGTAELEELCDTDVVDRLLADGAAEELAQRDIDFHCGIARLAGNSVVLDNLTLTLTRMRLYTAYHRHGAAEQAWHEHLLIATAVLAGDPHAAATAMREHLLGAHERMRTSA
jgi:DNA-binding GntR family transcriptional regulator